MSQHKQVFQTSSSLRWKTFQWVSRLFIFFLVLTIPVAWIAYKLHNDPEFASLSSNKRAKSKEINPRDFSPRDAKKYAGFDAFLKAKQKTALLIAAEKRKRVTTQKVRAGFYVDWDPQALYSLQSHINAMNMVIPEWFFIDSSTGKVINQAAFNDSAYNVMKQHNVRILPMLTNVNPYTHAGTFDPDILHKVLTNPAKSKQLIDDIYKYLQQYKLQGVNVDFEELRENTIVPMHHFLAQLYERLHPAGYLVTQDILPNDEDYDVKELAKWNDYIFLMAYDEHWSESIPGSISAQQWIEKQTDEIARKIPPEKLVLGLAAFGYDWPEGDDADVLTYQHALSTARIHNATVHFDNDTYNCTYNYTDNDSVEHKVYFVDAAGNFNTIRFADEYGAAGVALWRLGSEDERIWSFYGRDLNDQALKTQPFNYSLFSSIDMQTEKPDYFQDGEVLDVVANPQKGIINIEVDSSENLVSEEEYKQLPTRYVINRFGEVAKKDSSGKVVQYRVVLTFDDGPDPNYTPRILDILKKENVPAAFFVVGMNAENNLPILRRIYHEGYEIGNHSFTHPNMATISGDRAEMEMETTRLLIEAETGRSTILFRAPFNADAEPSKLVELKPVERGKTHHYYTVGESIDPDDWDVKHGVNADSIFNRVVRIYNMYGGEKGIILLHDAGGDREATVEALPRIIHYFKERGVKFATVGEILDKPRDVIMPPVHNEMIRLSSFSMITFYWIEKIIVAIFWVAILLGLGRTAFMGILAGLQYRRAKKEKALLASAWSPGRVSIIVPAYNEEINVIKTVENLLMQDYPDVEVVVVDDGSKDNTYKHLCDRFLNEQRVKLYTKPNGGKASALNFGIEHCGSDYIVCIDADTQLLPDAISKMMRYFRDEQVAAVAGNVKVGNEKNLLTRWQSIEYTTAQNFDRRAFDLINGITVIPGAIGAFRRRVLAEAGGFTTDTLAEDCDLTIRILRHGYKVRSCAEAIAVTEAPENLNQFMKQRFRWNYGIMQSFWKNRDACFNPKYRALGMVALPNILLFQILIPLFAPVADLLFVVSLIWNRHDPASMQKILWFYGGFLLAEMAVSLIAFAFEKQKIYKLIWLIPQRFAYRQLMYVVLFRSVRKAIKGEVQNWGVLKRTGNVKLVTNKPVPDLVTNKSVPEKD